MPTNYHFRLTPAGTLLNVKDEFGPFNTWDAIEHAEKLVVTSGGVDTSQSDRMICHSGPLQNVPVVTLRGASFDSKEGDEGDATCDLCQQTPGPQRWRLVHVD